MENIMIVKDKKGKTISRMQIEPTLNAALSIVGVLEIASKMAEEEGDKFPKAPLAVNYRWIDPQDLYYLRKATKDNPYFKID